MAEDMRTTTHPCATCGQRGVVMRLDLRLPARLTALVLCLLPVVAFGVAYANAPDISRLVGMPIARVPGWVWILVILAWCLIVEWAGKVAVDDFVAQESCPLCHGAGKVIRMETAQGRPDEQLDRARLSEPQTVDCP